jgi:hypothetical protein
MTAAHQHRVVAITHGSSPLAWRPNLHIRYKHTDFKQYFKEQAGLRTEITFNDVRDFLPIKVLSTLCQLRNIGNHINERLLDTERLSHACSLAAFYNTLYHHVL